MTSAARRWRRIARQIPGFFASLGILAGIAALFMVAPESAATGWLSNGHPWSRLAFWLCMGASLGLCSWVVGWLVGLRAQRLQGRFQERGTADILACLPSSPIYDRIFAVPVLAERAREGDYRAQRWFEEDYPAAAYPFKFDARRRAVPSLQAEVIRIARNRFSHRFLRGRLGRPTASQVAWNFFVCLSAMGITMFFLIGNWKIGVLDPSILMIVFISLFLDFGPPKFSLATTSLEELTAQELYMTWICSEGTLRTAARVEIDARKGPEVEWIRRKLIAG